MGSSGMAGAQAPDALRLRLTGAPALVRSDLASLSLGLHDAALLALLVIDGPLPRRRAAALLWPDSDAKRANISLRQRIFRLKRWAGCDLVVGDANIGWVDSLAHDLDVSGNAGAEGVPQGELLGGLDFKSFDELGAWVQSARQRWASQRAEHLSTQLAGLEQDGRIASALPLAQRLIELDPSAEHAHRRLMRLHYLRGDRAAALAAFDRCKHCLHEQLGEPPSPETLALVEAIGRNEVLAASLAPLPITLLRPPRLVGREAALAAIDQGLSRTPCVLLSGEAGMGKSRLLQELGQRAPGRIKWVRAEASDRAVAFALLGKLFNAVLEMTGALHVDSAPRWLEGGHTGPVTGALLRHATAWITDQARGRVDCLAVDDLHFADEASVEALLSMIDARSRDAPDALRWLFAFRANECPDALRAWADTTDADRFQRVALDPMGHAAAVEFLDSLNLPGLDLQAWAGALLRHAGGNPLFMLETLRAVRDREGRVPTLPDPAMPSAAAVGVLIERRLRALSAPARRLAMLAALAGVDFSSALAAQVLQVHEIDLAVPWRELETADVLLGAEFTHDAVREACLREVPSAVAAGVHAQLARALQAAEVAPARLAEHWWRAGAWADAAAALRAAAAISFNASRRREEAAQLQRAAEAFDRANEPGPAWQARCDRLGALIQFASHDEVRAASADLRRLAPGPIELALSDIAAAEAQIVFGEFEAVVNAMPAAIDACAASGDIESQLLASRRWAVACVNLGRGDEGARLLADVAPLLDQLPSLRPRYEFLGELGTVLERAGRRQEGRQAIESGLRLAVQARDLSTAATMHVNLGINHVYSGNAEAAVAATEAGLALREQDDGVSGLATAMQMTLGAMCRDVGRYGDAIGHLESALVGFEAEGNALWIVNTGTHLALTWLQLGQAARAESLLRQKAAQSIANGGIPPFIAARRLAALGLIERAQGRSALPLLERALQTMAHADRADVRLCIALERCAEQDAAAVVSLCNAALSEAANHELAGHLFAAKVYKLDACTRLAEHASGFDEARPLALALAADPLALAPSGVYRIDLWHLLARSFARVDLPGAAQSTQQAIDHWVGRAAAATPAVFQASFMQRSAAHMQRSGAFRRR